jgi:outer membrane receptor protein involved in Fe transport
MGTRHVRSASIARAAQAGKSIWRGSAALVALAGVAAAPAAAQEQGQRLTLEEIVVTAKQRSENLQEVPLSIIAFTGEGLQARNIIDVRDLAQFTPGLTYYSGSGRADPTALVVRGLSPQTSDERYQGLSIFVDGIFLSGQLTSIDLSNLERVEVIKGPQSVTFGRSTYSGAIDYITKTPKVDTVGGRVRVQLSTNDSAPNSALSYNLSARVEAPLIADKLWGSLNGTILRRGAPVKSPSTGEPMGLERTRAIGAVLYAEPSETFSVKARFAYDADRDTQPIAVIQEYAEWLAAGTALDAYSLNRFWPRGAIPAQDIRTVGGGELLVPIGRPVDGGRDRNRYLGTLIADWQLGDFTLSYLGGYFWDKYYSNGDFTNRSAVNDPFFRNAANFKSRVLAGGGSATDRALASGNNVAFDEEFENHSHQLRLVSPGEAALRYRGGLYYTKEWSTNTRPTSVTAANPRGLSRGIETVENYAAFGGFDYDLTDRLTAQAEARVMREIIVAESPGITGVAPVRDLTDKRTFFTPRLTLQYTVSDTANLYAQWARGYKAARFNVSTPQIPPAGPERLDAFEIGSKNEFFDGRARVNLAAFYMRIRDQQAFQSVPNPTPPPLQLTAVANFGNSRSYGFEVDSEFIILEGWRVQAGLAYADHQFTTPSTTLTDTFLFGPGETLEGKTSVNSPKWTISAATDYTTPVFNGAYELTLRLDMAYRSKTYVDPANKAWIKGVARFNARATLGTEMWDVSLFARDLFNTKTPLGAGLSGSSACLYARETNTNQRCLYVSPPRGREIGIEAVVNF